MCGERLRVRQTPLETTQVSPGRIESSDRMRGGKILLPFALHTSSILNTINLQTILYTVMNGIEGCGRRLGFTPRSGK